MKILIAVPTYETIMPDTFKSIYELDTGGHEVTFDFVRGYDCATARNKIAERALELEVDYVLMVDADMVLPQDALINLLEGENDICLGYCARRNSRNVYDGKTAIYRLGEFNYTMQFPVVELKQQAANGVNKLEVHGGGMACALIKTSLFKRLRFPWFDWVNYESKGVLSEDLYFCNQCTKAGITVYVDTRVGCGHLFRRVQWPD